MSTDSKLLIVMTHLLSLDNKHDKSVEQLTSIDTRLNHLEKLCQETWAPTKAHTVSHHSISFMWPTNSDSQ